MNFIIGSEDGLDDYFYKSFKNISMENKPGLTYWFELCL